MKTKTITYLVKHINALAGSINDFIPPDKKDEVVEHYTRVTELFGRVMYENVFYWLVNKELRYDRTELHNTLSYLEWKMFTDIEKRYLKILLFADVVNPNTITVNRNESLILN